MLFIYGLKRAYTERMNNVISNLPYDPRKTDGSLAPYVHEEALAGFPESVMVWRK
ncbi:hypothetical protein SAMN06298226_2841 [Nitrosovibrio sp. Nv4]|nr:hypothetical protein SAMN06298226_2841 [Nitrosovibrio sp. Nv4]